MNLWNWIKVLTELFKSFIFGLATVIINGNHQIELKKESKF